MASLYTTQRLVPVWIKPDPRHNPVHLLDIRLDENKTERRDTVKRVIYIMKELLKWFTLESDRRLVKRFGDFLERIPFRAFNDFKLPELSEDEDILKLTVHDNYTLMIDNIEFQNDLSSEEFLVKLAVQLM